VARRAASSATALEARDIFALAPIDRWEMRVVSGAAGGGFIYDARVR
jgi:hypothetical protein